MLVSIVLYELSCITKLYNSRLLLNDSITERVANFKSRLLSFKTLFTSSSAAFLILLRYSSLLFLNWVTRLAILAFSLCQCFISLLSLSQDIRREFKRLVVDVIWLKWYKFLSSIRFRNCKILISFPILLYCSSCAGKSLLAIARMPTTHLTHLATARNNIVWV